MEKLAMCMGNKEKNKSIGLLILRVSIAIIFLLNGIQKFIYMDQAIAFFHQIGLPAFMLWVVALVEVIGGAMILFGFMTCISSILLAIVMIVAMFMVTFKGGIVSSLVGSQTSIAMLGSVLAIFFIGPGKYALGCPCSLCKAMHCTCADGTCNDGVCACK